MRRTLARLICIMTQHVRFGEENFHQMVCLEIVSGKDGRLESEVL